MASDIATKKESKMMKMIDVSLWFNVRDEFGHKSVNSIIGDSMIIDSRKIR